jgi:NO-binding membrane sensor protein with MHYT domain
MLAGHDPYLVALSIVIAVLGGYTGFGIAARIRGTTGFIRRILLVGAAGFLAVGIWTMHFIGMLAAPIPADASYLVLPTIVSFLICALVVGVSLFFVSVGKASRLRLAASALLLGTGISSMHYVGIHGLSGQFAIEHDALIVSLSVLISVATAYGGLFIYIRPQTGTRLAMSALAFGIAVSGMHYTAMAGMTFVSGVGHQHLTGLAGGLAASPQILSLIVAFLCFVIAAGFLLLLMPETRSHGDLPAGGIADAASLAAEGLDVANGNAGADGLQLDGPKAPNAFVNRIPVQSGKATQFVDASEIRSIRADAHYSWVHDGYRERMSSWSISEAESALDPRFFIRVHRSYIASMQHVTLMRKEGEGAIVELDGERPHMVPVSRAKIADLKARLGLVKRPTVRQ